MLPEKQTSYDRWEYNYIEVNAPKTTYLSSKFAKILAQG